MANAASDEEILAAVLDAPSSFRKTLRREVFASGGFVFTVVSDLIAGAYIAIVVLTLVGLFFRYRRGTLWFWKEGRPNAPLIIQSLLAIYSTLAAYQVFAFYFTTDPVPVNYSIQLMMFLPVGLAAWFQLWGMANTLPHRRAIMALPHDPSRRVSATAKRFTLRNVRRAFPPIVRNIIFFFAPIVMFATAIPVAVIAGREHATVIESWKACDGMLAVASTDGWNEQTTAAIEIGLTKLREQDEVLGKSLRTCAYLYAAWVMIDIICFVPYAVALGSVIRKQIKTIRTSLNNSANLANVSALQPIPTLTLQTSPSIHRAPDMKSYDSDDSMTDVPGMAVSPWIPRGASPVFPPSPHGGNEPSYQWQGGYEDDLKNKMRKLKKVRFVFFANLACWVVAVTLFGVYAWVEAAGGYVGLLKRMDYHTYIVTLLWYPALGFLLSVIPATILFVWVSFSRHGHVSSSLGIRIPDSAHVVDISSLHDFAPRQPEPSRPNNRPAKGGDDQPPSWFSWSSRKSSISSWGNKHGKIDAASATTGHDDGMQIVIDRRDSTRRRSAADKGTLAGPGVWDVRPSQWAKERSEDKSKDEDHYTSHYKVNMKKR